MAKINIDFSKLKAGLGALRSFSGMIWPIVIVAAGAVVLAAAILMGRSFRQKVQRESVPLESQVKSMIGSAVPERQITIERQYQDAYQQDANQIERMEIKSTQRELISYDIFPKPKDTSALLFTDYSKKWQQKVEQKLAELNAKDCPTDEELRNIMQKSSRATPRWNIRYGASGDPEMDRLAEEFYTARAKSASTYINPEDIAGYVFWRDYQFKNVEKGVRDCWDWQIGYWIEEDVLTTIGAMNAGSSNVFTSPVKRLMAVGFITPSKLYEEGYKGGASRTGKPRVSQEKPKPVILPEEQITEACTARVSNEDVNVVHFSLIAVVDTKAILPFMKELCSVKTHTWKGYNGDEAERTFKHNQITILESAIEPVQATSDAHYKYRYGPDAVSEVRLICEYIFYKKGYEPINPEMIKTDPAAAPSDG